MQIKVHATSADIKRFVGLIKFMALCNKILPFGYFGDYSGFLFKRKKNLLNFFFPILMFFHNLMARRVTEIVF